MKRFFDHYRGDGSSYDPDEEEDNSNCTSEPSSVQTYN